MMAKRKMIQSNLLKNSISAYYAAIEIHNKPNIAYRYETVTLLMMNAWELALKAYVKKYIKNRPIFDKNNHTISFDKALEYVNVHRNSIQKKSFIAIKENLLKIENYRNQIAHFYCDELEPYIFMLCSRCALNYVEFIKSYFNKDIMAEEGLFILPLGFKLPFLPEDFLSGNVAKYAASEEAKDFIKDIIRVTSELKSEGIEESIVLGFDIHFKSVKKETNSDILAALTSREEADITCFQLKSFNISESANQTVKVNDDELRDLYKFSHAEVLEWCKENIIGFKTNAKFNEVKRIISNDRNCVYTRMLDSKNPKSSSQKFYSTLALNKIKELYEDS